MNDDVILQATLGNSMLSGLVTFGNEQAAQSSNFGLFGASNDSNPMSDPANRFAFSASRPPDDELDGDSSYVEDEPFTAQFVFTRNGEQHVFECTIPAAQATPGNSWTGPMVRVSSRVPN